MYFGLYAPLHHINMPQDFEPRFAGDSPYRVSRDAVQAADRAGFWVTLVAQRYLGPDLEAMVHAGALAEATERIIIMPAFHPTFWTPQVMAKMTATLDRISNGRAALNLVTGWWAEEHTMFGGLQLDDEARYGRAEEFVQVMHRLWTEEEVTFNGRHFQLDHARLPLKPVAGTPPIFGAARSERGLAMVARSCEWWFAPYPNDFRQPDENTAHLRRGIEQMRGRAAAAGRDIHFAANAFVIHDEDEQAARALAERIEAHGREGDIERIHSHGLGVGLIGSKARILDRLERLREAGVEMLLLKFFGVVEGVQRFGDEILPEAVRPRVAA